MTERQAFLRRLSRRLQQDGFPRLQMLLLVGLTGGAGFLASFTLLRVGWTSMSGRYPAAVLVAYGVFLLLLWLWLRVAMEDWLDAAADLVPERGSGGGCDGGGLEADGLPDLNLLDGADELAIPLMVVAAAAGLLLSCLWVVYSAPLLFAELLLDGVFSATLYRRLKRLERQHWLSSALRRTWLPFLLTAVLAGGCGAWLEHQAPGSASLGEALRALPAAE